MGTKGSYTDPCSLLAVPNILLGCFLHNSRKLCRIIREVDKVLCHRLRSPFPLRFLAPFATTMNNLAQQYVFTGIFHAFHAHDGLVTQITHKHYQEEEQRVTAVDFFNHMSCETPYAVKIQTRHWLNLKRSANCDAICR